MSETSMWLFPVALAGAIGLYFGVRYGCKWTWGMCLQQFLIVFTAVLGLLAIYVPTPFAFGVAPLTAGGIFAVLSWLAFGLFNFFQRYIVNQISTELSLFRTAKAREYLPIMRLVLWGPPASYWQNAVDAMALYAEDRTAEADAVLDKTWHDPRLPSQSRENLVGFYMLGRLLRNDWKGILRLFVHYSSVLSVSRSMVAMQMAMRACAELGEFDKAAVYLDHCALAGHRASIATLDINFMTLFALFGATEHVQDVFVMCKDKNALPDYVRDYWLGRCYGIRSETDKAIALMEQSKSKTPPLMGIWQQRIDQNLIIQREIKSGLRPANFRVANSAIVEKAHKLYTQGRLSSDLLRPSHAKFGVVSLIFAICLAYVATNPDQFLSAIPSLHSVCALVKHNAYALGEVSLPKLLHGEWWRAITYMFLHGNSAHLLLNAGALYLFGKSVENIYGTPKFFVIYFGSGILSGLAQVALMPQDGAIGASGAILGVFGAAIAGMLKLKDVLPAATRKGELRWMLSVAVAQVVFDQLVNIITGMTDKTHQGIRIASFAHLGGMVFGFLIGMMLPTRRWTELSVDPLALAEAQSSSSTNSQADSDVNSTRST